MKQLKNKVAAITGAASGIGRMLAIRLAYEGSHLAISDIDETGLMATKKMIGDHINISTHVADVGIYEQVCRFAEEAVAYHGKVDLLINNAGVSLTDFLETVPLEDFKWLMDINFWGVVHGTMAFLPFLKRRPEGHIVNISSISAMLPNPNNGPYCAAKSAVKGYTETLYQELMETNIHVSCVHPGGIKTNLGRNARVNRTLSDISKETAVELCDKEVFITTAEQAAKTIIAGIKRNKRRIITGIDAKVIDILTRLFPQTMISLCAISSKRLAKKYADLQGADRAIRPSSVHLPF
ncbi:MAG: SDR family oxidoreductase [Proteobacteria bacterium]|nr:SDR family oxidoreductase [Pseudomonadota bacterium]